MINQSRKYAELMHGEKIVANAEAVWGWESPAGRVRAKRRAELLIAQLPRQLRGPVLELGCGSGVFTRQFVAHTPELVAIDISAPLLKRASQFSGFTGYCASDAELLPFADMTFAAALGSSVLHHLDVQRTLAELWRVLKPNGIIAFAEPNMLNPQILLQKNIPALKERLGDSPDERAFIRWTLSRQLLSLGFTDITVQPYDFLHPIVPTRLIPMVSRMGQQIEQVPLVREIAGSLIISARKP